MSTLPIFYAIGRVNSPYLFLIIMDNLCVNYRYYWQQIHYNQSNEMNIIYQAVLLISFEHEAKRRDLNEYIIS